MEDLTYKEIMYHNIKICQRDQSGSLSGHMKKPMSFDKRREEPLGACLYSFFHYFTPFLAKSWPFNGSVWQGQICERTNFFTFPPDLEKSGGIGRPPPPDFFLCQIDFFAIFPRSSWSSLKKTPRRNKQIHVLVVGPPVFRELSQRGTH
jgi:hypothetical protein